MTVKSNFRLVNCAIMLSIIILSGFTEISGVAAVPPVAQKQTNLWDKIVFFVNHKLLRKGRAGARDSRLAGGRSEKSGDLVALIPANGAEFTGVTISNQPTFWFYISPNFNELNIESMVFNLIDSKNDKEIIWSSKLLTNSLKIGSGLMPITYKGDKLKADGTYYWELEYQQAGNSTKKKIFGNIQKATIPYLPVNQKISDRISTYARNGIWYDLVTELITKKQQNPSDQQLANAFRTLIFESPDVKYFTPNDEKKDDLVLMEEIVNAKVLKLPWSN